MNDRTTRKGDVDLIGFTPLSCFVRRKIDQVFIHTGGVASAITPLIDIFSLAEVPQLQTLLVVVLVFSY